MVSLRHLRASKAEHGGRSESGHVEKRASSHGWDACRLSREQLVSSQRCRPPMREGVSPQEGSSTGAEEGPETHRAQRGSLSILEGPVEG